MYGCLLYTSHWGPGLQPRHVPQWKSNWRHFVSQAGTQSTELHQPRLPHLKNSFIEIQFTYTIQFKYIIQVSIESIKFNNFSYTHKVVQLSPQTILEHFITSKKKPYTLLSHPTHHFSPPAISTKKLIMDLPILDISHQ